MSDKIFYITTPIYYVNDKPHIGHVYTSIACDVLARFKRLDGYRVKFLTGTDEHAQKVAQKAQEAGEDVYAYATRFAENFRAVSKDFNLSNDDFIRTSEPRHKDGATALWHKLIENEQIYLGKYAGWYAVSDEAFYAEDETVVDGGGVRRAVASGAQVEWLEQPSYFFKLSEWQKPLLDFYDKHPDFIAPRSRRNEVISFVKGGLHDLSVSRPNVGWGIEVPDNPNHVMYVWVDALANYLSALGYPDEQGEYRTFWPASLHMMGKDIIRFHVVYWPALLMAAGIACPTRIFAHGWWTNEGKKMSKSLGNALDPYALKDTYGLDALRYFLMREVSFGEDGDFSHERMIHRVNMDLANDLGNLAQRVLSFVNKHCHAAVPEKGTFTAEDTAMLAKAHGLLDTVRKALDQQQLDQGLKDIWSVIADANRYVDQQAPWSLRKTDTARMQTVLYVVMEVLRTLALLLQPYMPTASATLLDQLGVAAAQRTFACVGMGHALGSGTPLPAPVGIFPRHVDTTAAA